MNDTTGETRATGSMTDAPVIINAAITGMVPTKEMTPHVPTSVDEIVADAIACADAGASIIHVHARDHEGAPTSDPEAFAPIVRGIREAEPSLIVCVTCSGRKAKSFDERARVLDLDGDAKPDMASLTMGSNNFITEASVNSPEMIKSLAVRMSERGIKPELEVFEPGMLGFARYLAEKGTLPAPAYVNILLGNLGTSPATPLALGTFLAEMPDDWIWAVAGLGRFQLRANVMGMVAGGHVRVGIEDNIWYDQARTELAANAALVKRVAELAEMLERQVAEPKEARDLLGL